MCLSVGQDTYTGRIFGEEWNGTQWTLPTELEGIAGTRQSAISCPSASSCTSVGGATVRRWTQVLNHWGVGSETPATPPGASDFSLNDVSCSSTSACTAVGTYTAEGVQKTLAETWNGTQWSVQTTPNPTPNPASGGDFLTGVYCESSSSCIAMGVAGKKTLVALRWDGKSWTTMSIPSPQGVAGASEVRPASVSCGSSTSCVVVGYLKEENNGTEQPFSEVWNGSTWSLDESLPMPGDLQGNSYLTDISCAPGAGCTAVGRYGTEHTILGDTKTGTLVEQWDGSSWAVRSSPNGEGRKNRLDGVACRSETSCIAAGASEPKPFSVIYK